MRTNVDAESPMNSAPQQRADPCRRGFRGYKRIHSLAAIVRDYIRRHRSKANCELQYFRNLPNLSAAIREAGLARYPDGQRFKRYPHQRRLSPDALEIATKRLGEANLRSARSFDELITRVSAAVQPVDGIGELYVYDTALRLGGYLGFLPRKIYLHAGTRQGAKVLGLDHRSDFVSRNQLPLPIRRLKPHEIEDVLCIYKDWLRSVDGV
jgi:hypothetical protein